MARCSQYLSAAMTLGPNLSPSTAVNLIPLGSLLDTPVKWVCAWTSEGSAFGSGGHCASVRGHSQVCTCALGCTHLGPDAVPGIPLQHLVRPGAVMILADCVHMPLLMSVPQGWACSLGLQRQRIRSVCHCPSCSRSWGHVLWPCGVPVLPWPASASAGHFQEQAAANCPGRGSALQRVLLAVQLALGELQLVRVSVAPVRLCEALVQRAAVTAQPGAEAAAQQGLLAAPQGWCLA